MSFLNHAAAHGLIIRHLIADDRWHRCPTTDHPRKRNGAYIYDGNRGAVQNWATMQAISLFRPEGGENLRYDQWRRQVRNSFAAERARQELVREQARALIKECQRGPHPYLKTKGFPMVRGLVHPSSDLLVPMHEFSDYHRINSVQRISRDGVKLFLPGGKAKESVYIIGNPGRERWLVEGYATALSVHAALMDMRRQQIQVVCCFSAGNLMRIAELVRRPAFVMADNDDSNTGRASAIATGLPWVMPNEVGTDANDVHQRHGLRALVALMRGIR